MVRLVALFLAVGTAACASSGAFPRPFPRPGGPGPAPANEPAAPPAGSRDGYSIAGTALSFRGAPYRNGGADPAGFDCSGFVYYVFARHGIRVGRTVTEQYHAGHAIDAGRLEPGDLVFFNTGGSGPSHVGIAIGGDEFVHAPSTNGEVRVERLGSGYWSGRFVGARSLK
jgi:cell wall-associated NlpC family hydrolase